MSFVLLPWQLLVLIVSAWMTKAQQELIDYVLTENQALKEKLGGKRIVLNDDQRRRLAVRARGWAVRAKLSCVRGRFHRLLTRIANVRRSTVSAAVGKWPFRAEVIASSARTRCRQKCVGRDALGHFSNLRS